MPGVQGIAPAAGGLLRAVGPEAQPWTLPGFIQRYSSAMSRSEWVVVQASDGGVPAREWHRTWQHWLRSWGIDWEPFEPGEVRFDFYRVAKPDGNVGCSQTRSVQAHALRRLGIEPPTRVNLGEFVSRGQ